MTRRPRPPTPRPARLLWIRLTWWTALVCLIGIIAAGVVWNASGELSSLIVALPGIFLFAASLTNRIRIVHELMIVGATTTAGWVMGSPLIGLLVGVGWVALAAVGSRRFPDDLTSDSIIHFPEFLVGRGAEQFVQEFEQLGYQPAGSYGFPTMGNVIVASVLVGPGSDRYATVTDAILTITTQFDVRTLVTRNSAMTRMAPHALDNPLRGASPIELDQSHSTALEMVRRDLVARILDAKSATVLAIDNERRDIHWLRAQESHLLPGKGVGRGPLSEDPDADRLIAEWREEDSSPGGPEQPTS